MMRIAIAGFLNLLLGLSAATAQSYPTRPIQVIVPASPAGITDIAARFLGERLSELWGKQVVVDNRPGGGGSIGVAAAVRSTPDGYTLLMTTNGELALNPAINAKSKYDFRKDLVPIAMVTNNPIVLAANTSSPYKTLADVVAAAKAQPGNIAWASPGVGTWNHLTGEWLADALGIKLLHVPYRGGGPAGTALAGGEIPLGFVAISSALPHVQSGRVRVLALTSAHRSKADPEWPTVAEGAVPGFDSKQWVGLYAPAGIDPAIRDKIEADVLSILAQPAVKSRFETAGVEVIGLRGAEALKQLEADSKIATEIARKANIHVE
ncbi:MAG: tripartite tricarboxylate transporter substrate binding protein [Pseudomonadota bacterium]